jgi:hypothetical protein
MSVGNYLWYFIDFRCLPRPKGNEENQFNPFSRSGRDKFIDLQAIPEITILISGTHLNNYL